MHGEGLKVKRPGTVQTNEEQTRAAENRGQGRALNLEIVADRTLESHDGARVDDHLLVFFQRSSDDGALAVDAHRAVADEPFAVEDAVALGEHQTRGETDAILEHVGEGCEVVLRRAQRGGGGDSYVSLGAHERIARAQNVVLRVIFEFDHRDFIARFQATDGDVSLHAA